MRDFWKRHKPLMHNMLMRYDADEIDLIERPEVLNYLPHFDGQRVLDLASGIGRFTADLAKRASHVTAVDLVPQFIEESRKKNPTPNVTHICADALEINFPNAHFDLIFVSGFLMYLEIEELKILTEKMFRWLSLAGHLFIRDCCSWSAETITEYYAQERPLYFYHQFFDPIFTLIDSGSIQTYIDLFADPFRCYFLYRKDRIENIDKLI